MDDIKLITNDAISKRILDAALLIVKEEGYENLKIRKVASVSGCSNSAIYTRFEDKEALCNAIAKLHAQPVYELMSEIYRPESDVITNLQRMAQAEMEIFYAMDLDSCIQQMRYRGKDNNNPFINKIEEVLINANKKGEIRISNTTDVAFSIEASFWGFMCMVKANSKLNLEDVRRMLGAHMNSMILPLLSNKVEIDIWDSLRNMGVNVDKALERLKGNKDAYKMFIVEFLEEPDFSLLLEAINEEKVQEAFEYAHGLKGMAANLGFEKVLEPLFNLVEILRASSLEGALEKYNLVMESCREISLLVYN